MYNTQKYIIIIFGKCISAKHLPWLAQYIIWYPLLMWLCLLIIRCVAHCFTVASMPVFIFILYTDSWTMSHIFSMPIWLLGSYYSICFAVEEGLLSSYPSWQCHQSLPVHFLLVSIVTCWAPFLLSCVTNPVWCISSAFAGVYVPMCILSITCCICWDIVATSLLSVATKGLCSVNMHTSLMKYCWIFSNPCRTQRALHYMLL